MNFAFICTNYNNTEYTRAAVRSLSENVVPPSRIVVVDNASRPEKVQALKELASEYDRVELILNPENVGYFRGLNLGIRHVRAHHPEVELLVIGNEDLSFPPDFGESLQKNKALFEKYPVVSPDIVTMDGVHQNPHAIHKLSKFREHVIDLYYANYSVGMLVRKIASWSRPLTERRDCTLHDVAQEIYIGLGACYILGPEFFRNFDELWAPTFLVHEEYFFSKQLSDKGFRIYYEPSIRVLHHFRVSMDAFGNRKSWQLARTAHKIRREYERKAQSTTQFS